MKKIITSLCLIFLMAAALSAQTKTNNKLGVQSKPTAKDTMMCAKEWKVTSVEEWGVASKPGDKNKNDMLKMSLDGKYELVLFGEKKSGTWTKSGQYIYFVDEATQQKFNYKIVTVETSKLKFDYRDPDETHTIFEMQPK